MFEIHPQLKNDCIVLGRFELCILQLMNDSNYPWFILVPQRENVKEIFQLDESDQQQLFREITLFSEQLSLLFKPEKINVAALGNVVPQLHVHVIARYKDDPAWPAPVWGKVPAKAYTDEEKQNLIMKVKEMYLPNVEWIIV